MSSAAAPWRNWERISQEEKASAAVELLWSGAKGARMTVLLCHVATTKPWREATTQISPPLNWAHPQLTRQNPPQNDKLEFPAQAQTSEIHPKLKVFLRHRLGPSPCGSFGQCFPSCLCWCQAAVPGILRLPHPSSSPARCHAQLPALLALRCAKVHSNGLTQDPGTSPVGATWEAPATDPLLPWKFAPAHLSWKDPHLAQQLSVPSCGSWWLPEVIPHINTTYKKLVLPLRSCSMATPIKKC